VERAKKLSTLFYSPSQQRAKITRLLAMYKRIVWMVLTKILAFYFDVLFTFMFVDRLILAF